MNKSYSGFVLVEGLIYIVIMVFVASATTYFVFTVQEAYRSVQLGALSDRVGTTIINQAVRDTRSASSIDYGGSVLDVANGAISLNLPSGSVNSYAVSNGQVFFTEDAADPVSLSPAAFTVTRFWVTEINTPVSQAVRYDVGISYELGGVTETRYYNGLAILRRSYD